MNPPCENYHTTGSCVHDRLERKAAEGCRGTPPLRERRDAPAHTFTVATRNIYYVVRVT